MQSQKALSAYLSSHQILPFGFVGKYAMLYNILLTQVHQFKLKHLTPSQLTP